MFETGIQKWSALFDLALESGHLTKATQGWYNMVDQSTGEIIEPKRRLKDIETDDEFFEGLCTDPKFKRFVEDKFKLTMVDREEYARDDDIIESDS